MKKPFLLQVPKELADDPTAKPVIVADAEDTAESVAKRQKTLDQLFNSLKNPA